MDDNEEQLEQMEEEEDMMNNNDVAAVMVDSHLHHNSCCWSVVMNENSEVDRKMMMIEMEEQKQEVEVTYQKNVVVYVNDPFKSRKLFDSIHNRPLFNHTYGHVHSFIQLRIIMHKEGAMILNGLFLSQH